MNTGETHDRVVGKVLLVDDEQGVRGMVGDYLRNAGFEVRVLDNVADGLDSLTRERFQLVLTGISVEGGSGLDILNSLRKQGEDTPVVMLTRIRQQSIIATSMKLLGATDILCLPTTREMLEYCLGSLFPDAGLKDSASSKPAMAVQWREDDT